MTIFAQNILYKKIMEIKVGDLAEILGGTVEGDAEKIVKGFAKIEEAKEGDLSFIANPKYARYITETKASAVLVYKDFKSEGDVSSALIRVEDPYVSLAELMRLVESKKPLPHGIEQPVYISEGVDIPSDCYIGAFAYIGKNVSIGKGALIYPQVYIGDNACIGDGTILYAGVKIYSNCKIGKRCIIHSGAVIGSDGFGFALRDDKYEKIPQTGIVEIADDVEIGANTTIDRATFGKTIIGKGTKLDNLIQIAHNVTLGENNVIAAQAGIAGSVHMGSGNRIGGQVGFEGHIKVGNNNEFGAKSGVHGNIGDNRRLIGYPAVDIIQFARTSVYLKRLEELFKEHQKRNKNGTVNP